MIQRLPEQEVAYSSLTAISRFYIHKLVRLILKIQTFSESNVLWQGDPQLKYMMYEQATLVTFKPFPDRSYGRSYPSCHPILPPLLSLKTFGAGFCWSTKIDLINKYLLSTSLLTLSRHSNRFVKHEFPLQTHTKPKTIHLSLQQSTVETKEG